MESSTKDASNTTAGGGTGIFPRLEVRGFGPIVDATLPIDELIVLIGEQASGKSTLAKLIYFFQAMPESVDEHAVRLADGLPFENWVKLVRQGFMDSFGTTKHLPPFHVAYHYNAQASVRLTQEKKSGHIRVEPSAALSAAIVKRIRAESSSEDLGASVAANPIDVGLGRGENIEHERLKASSALRQLTDCQAARLFIPSARSLLAALSTDLIYNDLPNLDPLMRHFVQRIGRLRRAFERSLEDQLDNELHAKLRDVPMDQKRTEMAIKLIRTVLKGEYVYDRGKERIELQNGQSVYLRFASSGQQEALWILLVLFAIILQNSSASVIIEEPEAHLFPFAQRNVIELITLCKNICSTETGLRNGAVITTHSPYVLGALNNLLYAFQVAQRGPEARKKVADIVDSALWLNPSHVGVWFVENGGIRSIIDSELHLIRAEEIDGVSGALRSCFDSLEEIDLA